MGGYLTTAGTMVATVIVLIIVLNRNSALGTIANKGIVPDVKSLATLSNAGPGN